MVEKVFSDDLLMNKFDFFVNVVDNNLTFFENARELYVRRIAYNAIEIKSLNRTMNTPKLNAAQVAVAANRLRKLTFENHELRRRLDFIRKIYANSDSIKKTIKEEKSA